MSEPPPFPADMDATMAIARRFEARAARDPALAGAVLGDVLRLVPGKRAVLSGRFDGHPAIYRFHFDAPQENATRSWAELTRTAGYMCEGDLRVNAPLHHVPDLGLVVVEHAPGTPLMQHLWRTPRRRGPGISPPRRGGCANTPPLPRRMCRLGRRGGSSARGPRRNASLMITCARSRRRC